MIIVKLLGRCDEGGSCSMCNSDYIGIGIEQWYPDERLGYRVLGESEEIEESVVEPYNVCECCLANNYTEIVK